MGSTFNGKSLHPQQQFLSFPLRVELIFEAPHNPGKQAVSHKSFSLLLKVRAWGYLYQIYWGPYTSLIWGGLSYDMGRIVLQYGASCLKLWGELSWFKF